MDKWMCHLVISTTYDTHNVSVVQPSHTSNSMYNHDLKSCLFVKDGRLKNGSLSISMFGPLTT